MELVPDIVVAAMFGRVSDQIESKIKLCNCPELYTCYIHSGLPSEPNQVEMRALMSKVAVEGSTLADEGEKHSFMSSQLYATPFCGFERQLDW